MKGKIPTYEDLARLYYELGRIGARAVGEKKKWAYRLEDVESLLALACEWSRFDPRLLEVLVEYGLHHWQELRPQALREKMKTMETPQTVGVIASFVQSARPDDKEIQAFWDYLTFGLKPVSPQFYFRDLYAPGSRLARRAVLESLAEFKAWGFLARARIVVDTATKKTVGTWDQEARLNILRRLFSEKKQIQVSDYLEELNHTFSRQQALLDLKSLGAKQKEKGRGAYWVFPSA